MSKTLHPMFVPFGQLGIREKDKGRLFDPIQRKGEVNANIAANVVVQAQNVDLSGVWIEFARLMANDVRKMQEMAMGVDRYAPTPQPVRTIEPREGSVLRRFVEPSMNRHQAREHLSRQGPRLGEGVATWAYKVKVAVPYKFEQEVVSIAELDAEHNGVRHSEDRCLRISAKEDGSRAVVELALQHQDDPWAPKVFDVMELRNGDWASEMELLSKGDFEALKKSPWFEGGEYSTRITPTVQLMSVSPFMYAVHRLVRARGWSYDLHSQNIMFRGEQPVILDPVFAD